MHELSIMSNILQIILEYAEKNNAKKINIVNLKIGALSDVVPEWAQTYFDMLTKDTIADNAKLVIERVQVKIQCHDCGHTFQVLKPEDGFICQNCQSSDIEIIEGRELQVTSIDIE